MIVSCIYVEVVETEASQVGSSECGGLSSFRSLKNASPTGVMNLPTCLVSLG